MTVGTPTSKGQIDSQSGQLAGEIERWSQRVLNLKAYLDSVPDADMESNFGYTAGEVAILKSAYSDLAQLARTYQGHDTVTPARDMGVFSRQLAGLLVA